MKERPILFSASMVQAILSGRKTQTRRIIKPRNNNSIFVGWDDEFVLDAENKEWVLSECPYGNPGDRLWVRETWAKQLDGKFIYRADCQEWEKADYTATGVWRPSIHMHRAACRLLLQITDIRVERLQDISEEDAKEEGVKTTGGSHYSYYDYGIDMFCLPTAAESYKTLWEKINGPESWGVNPWVWVIEFEKINEA